MSTAGADTENGAWNYTIGSNTTSSFDTLVVTSADDDAQDAIPESVSGNVYLAFGSSTATTRSVATFRTNDNTNTNKVRSSASLQQEAAATPEPPAALTPFEPPDGGLIAWCQVVAGFLLSAIAWGWAMMFGVYQLYYTQTLGLDAQAVSWIGSLQTFLTYLFSTVSGQLADAGYPVHVTVVGIVLLVTGGFWTSFAAPALPTVDAATIGSRGGGAAAPVPASLFLSQAVLTGIGLGLMTASALPSVNGFFRHRRTVALSISSVGTSFGGALLPVVVQYLMPAVGFAWAVRCATLLALVVCGNAVLLLRKPPMPPPVTPAVPASTEAASPKSKRTFTLAACISYISDQLVDKSAFRELPFMLFFAGSFFLYWALYFGYYYINVYAEDIVGFSTNRATTLLILSTALGMPARPLSGAVADAGLGALDTLVLATVLLAASLFGWLAVGRSAAGMYVFVVLFGLCNGAVQSVWLGSVAELSAARPARLGVRFGMACTVGAVATLAGAPTASALIQAAGGDATEAGTYHMAQIWAASTTLASAVVLAAARVAFVGWRLRGAAH